MNRQLWVMIKKELYQRRWAIFGFCVAALLFLVLYIQIYPSFKQETAKFDELLQAYPKALLEAFNIEQLSLSTVEGYISAEHFSFVWPLLAIFLSLSMAGVALAGEIEKGTMAFLLSQPLSRAHLFAAKYCSGLIVLGLFIVFSVLSIIPLAGFQSLDINVVNVFKTALLSFCFAWAIYSMGMMVSSRVSEKSKVYFAMGGLLVIMYVANLVSGLVNSLDKLKYVSFFHYYSPDKALVSGRLYGESFAVFILVAVIATLVGIYVFRQRDISV